MSFIKYVKESFAELHKVAWPTKKQAIRSTLIILGFTIIFSLLIALVDFGFTQGIKELLYKII